MNNETRKKIPAIIAQIESCKDEIQNQVNVLNGIGAEVNDLAGQEREKFDNMPEGLQGSDRGQAVEDAANSLEEAQSLLDSFAAELDDLDAAIEHLNAASG